MFYPAVFLSLYLFPFVSSQALAAWSNGVGDQVIYQNASTGDLLYSIATGSGIGAGGFTAWAKLPLTTAPKSGSKLAGTGFVSFSYLRSILS